MNVYIISVSKPADLAAKELVKSFKSNVGFRVFGVAGSIVQREGLDQRLDNLNFKRSNTIYRTEHLVDVVKNIDKIIEDVKSLMPSVIITIGNWDFASIFYKKLKMRKEIIRTHYVEPEWGKYDRKNIDLDYIFSIYPNREKEFIPVSVEYVGNPIIEVHNRTLSPENVYSKFGIKMSEYIIPILPGYDASDIKRNLPIYLKVLEELVANQEKIYPVIFYDYDNEDLIRDIVSRYKININVFKEEEQKIFFERASAVIVGQKFVSLDLVLSAVPHIIAYKQSFAEKFINPNKLRYINIANNSYEKEIVPVFINKDCNKDNLYKLMLDLIHQDDFYKSMKKEFIEAYDFFYDIKYMPSEKVVKVVTKIIEDKDCIEGINCVYKHG